MAKLDMAIAIKYHWKLLKFQFLASLVPIKRAIFPTWLQCVYTNFHVSTQVLPRVVHFLSILSFNGAIGATSEDVLGDCCKARWCVGTHR